MPTRVEGKSCDECGEYADDEERECGVCSGKLSPNYECDYCHKVYDRAGAKWCEQREIKDYHVNEQPKEGKDE